MREVVELKIDASRLEKAPAEVRSPYSDVCILIHLDTGGASSFPRGGVTVAGQATSCAAGKSSYPSEGRNNH